jgi:hypothetical protein
MGLVAVLGGWRFRINHLLPRSKYRDTGNFSAYLHEKARTGCALATAVATGSKAFFKLILF